MEESYEENNHKQIRNSRSKSIEKKIHYPKFKNSKKYKPQIPKIKKEEKNEKKYEILTMKDIINIVLQNDLTYPGLHQSSCERTKISLPMLDEYSQLILIWKIFCSYIEKKLIEGISVNIKNFGTFFFVNENDIKTSSNMLFTKSFTDITKYNIKKLSFQLSSNYRRILKHFPDEKKKRKILQPDWKSENKNLIEWNPFPISKLCYLKDDIIRDGIENIFKAIFDVVEAKKNILIQTGFCNIYFLNGEMKYSFEENTLSNDVTF